MTFDTIAFTQDELDNALNLCCTSIGLCDNDFILPQIAGVTYISIGEISAKAKFKKDDMKKHNINCIGFVPQFAPQICEHSPSVSQNLIVAPLSFFEIFAGTFTEVIFISLFSPFFEIFTPLSSDV